MNILPFIFRRLFYHPVVFLYGFIRSFFCTKKAMSEPIDFVVTWVDGNDEEWQKDKNKYEEHNDFNRLNSVSSLFLMLFFSPGPSQCNLREGLLELFKISKSQILREYTASKEKIKSMLGQNTAPPSATR